MEKIGEFFTLKHHCLLKNQDPTRKSVIGNTCFCELQSFGRMVEDGAHYNIIFDPVKRITISFQIKEDYDVSLYFSTAGVLS